MPETLSTVLFGTGENECQRHSLTFHEISVFTFLARRKNNVGQNVSIEKWQVSQVSYTFGVLGLESYSVLNSFVITRLCVYALICVRRRKSTLLIHVGVEVAQIVLHNQR